MFIALFVKAGHLQPVFPRKYKKGQKLELDGIHSIRCKGIQLDVDEDSYSSASKFVFSRSKYTNHLIVIMQDNATVHLKP